MKVIAVSAHKAAKLCGCKNVRQFKSEVKRGIWPRARITSVLTVNIRLKLHTMVRGY